MAAVEKFKAAEQDAEICIYVRSSGTNFFPLSPNICTGQCYNPPKRTSIFFRVNVTEASDAAECSTVNTSESFATCCRSWGQKSFGMQLPFVNVNIMKGPF